MDALEPLPREDEMEVAQKRAKMEMMRVLTASAREMVEHEIDIALGKITDKKGNPPDFMVQHLAAKSLRQQIMGSPKQTVETHNTSKSISFKGSFEIPTTPIDPRHQPEKIDIPEAQVPRLPPQSEIPKIMTSGPTPQEVIKSWRQGSIEAALSTGLDEYGAELPKEEK